jgi:hypothetical protein
MSLTALAALIAQPFIATAPAGTGSDLVFEIASEHFVREAARPTRYEDITDRRRARLLRMLGCDRAACRDEAESILESLGWDNANRRALIWGSMSPDAEIARQSRAIMGRFVCPMCEGWGLCPDCLGRNIGGRWNGSCEAPGGYRHVGYFRYVHVCPSCYGEGKRQPDPFHYEDPFGS